MTTARILNGLLLAALLGCTYAIAGESLPPDGNAANSVKVSELRCGYEAGQIRCTFGG